MSDSLRIRRASATAEVDWTDERNESFDAEVAKAYEAAVRDELAKIETKLLTIKDAHHAGLHARVDRLLSELLTHIHSV